MKTKDLTDNRIFYCHGFASCFEPTKEKVTALSTLAPVQGLTVDYTLSPGFVFRSYAEAITLTRCTLLVGTSLGGFFAAWLGSELGLPFVAINPAIAPSRSLRKYIGAGRTFFETDYLLRPEVVDAYMVLPFRLDGHGLIALDLGDEVINSSETQTSVGSTLPVLTFEGGSHRFDHMAALLPEIRSRFLRTQP